MSWGISPNATEKEKIFADFNDSLQGMNSVDGLSYHHYSSIYDIGRKLADKEYQQGKVDTANELIKKIKELKVPTEDWAEDTAYNLAIEDAIKIAMELKERKMCSNGEPCIHLGCKRCGTSHFISDCDYEDR